MIFRYCRIAFFVCVCCFPSRCYFKTFTICFVGLARLVLLYSQAVWPASAILIFTGRMRSRHILQGFFYFVQKSRLILCRNHGAHANDEFYR